MKRVITIEAPEEFAFIHQGFIIGGGRQQTKTMSVLRLEAKILDRLDSISEPILSKNAEGKEVNDLYPSGDPARKFKEGELVLEPAEHELLAKYFDDVPWSVRVAREIVTLSDKIRNAEERPDLMLVLKKES